MSFKATAHTLCYAVLASAGFIGAAAQGATDCGDYFNSSEPGCDGSNPDILFCDDFDDGSWYVIDGTQCGSGSGADDDGWAGYHDATQAISDETGNGALAQCGGKGAVGTDCAAVKGELGERVHAQGWHGLKEDVTELYFRFYFYVPPGAVLTHEKIIGFGDRSNFTSTNGDFGFLDSRSYSYEPRFAVPQEPITSTVQSGFLPNNISTEDFEPGNWHYIEMHLDLGSRSCCNGVFEMWFDNCGASGLECTGPGTLRARYDDVNYSPYAGSDATSIGQFMLLTWAPGSNNGWDPPHSVGDRRYDQIVVSKSRIGPMGSPPDPNPDPDPDPDPQPDPQPDPEPDPEPDPAPDDPPVTQDPPPDTGEGYTVTTTSVANGVVVSSTLGTWEGPVSFFFDCGAEGNWDGVLEDVDAGSASYTCPSGTESVRAFAWDKGARANYDETVAVGEAPTTIGQPGRPVPML